MRGQGKKGTGGRAKDGKILDKGTGKEKDEMRGQGKERIRCRNMRRGG